MQSHSNGASSPSPEESQSINVSFAHDLPAAPSPPPQRVVREGAASLDAFRAGAQQSVREFETHLHQLQALMQQVEDEQTRPRTPPQYRDDLSAAIARQPAPRSPPPRRPVVAATLSDDDDEADLSIALNPGSTGHEALQRVQEIERARAERKRRSMHAQRMEDERRWNELDLSDVSVAHPPRNPTVTTHRAGPPPRARAAAPRPPQPPRRRSISPPSFFEHLASVDRPPVPSHLSQSTPLPKRGGAASAGNPLHAPAWKRLHDVAADEGWELRSEQQQVHPVDAATARDALQPQPQPTLTQWPFLSAKPVRISYEQAARQQSQSSAQPRRSIYAAVGRSRSRSPYSSAVRARDPEEIKEEFRPSTLLSPSASELFAMQLEAMDAAQKQQALRDRRQTERLQEQQRRSVAEIVRSPERLRSTQRVQPASPPPPPRSPAAAIHKPQPKEQPRPRPITPSSPLAPDEPSPPSSPPTPPRRVRAVDHMRRTPRIEPPVVLRSPIRVLPPPLVPASTLGDLEFAPLPSFASTPALSSAVDSPSLSPVRARTASPIRAPAREASPRPSVAYSSSPPRVVAAPAPAHVSPLREAMAPSSSHFERPHPSSSLAYTPPLSSSLAFTPPPPQEQTADSPARSLQVTLSSVRMHSSELDGGQDDDDRSDRWSLASESPRHAPAMQPSPPTTPPAQMPMRPPVASPSSLAFDASMRASFGASFGTRSGSTSASVSVLFGSRIGAFSPKSTGHRAPRPSPEAARVERRLLRYSLLLPATSSPRTR